MLRRESMYLNSKSKDSLSHFDVMIDGVNRSVNVINTDNLNEKFILSMPGETIPLGGTVEWMKNHWLISEMDASTELYTKCKMIQCNYLLRWVDDTDSIHEQWCVIEDGTKYLTGAYEDRDFIITRGDSRIVMILPKNDYTSKMKRGDRFLIDDAQSVNMLAYELTKPLKLGWVYNDSGIFKFVLQEVNTTEDDNTELSIADYYKHFPKDQPQSGGSGDATDSDGERVWI